MWLTGCPRIRSVPIGSINVMWSPLYGVTPGFSTREEGGGGGRHYLGCNITTLGRFRTIILRICKMWFDRGTAPYPRTAIPPSASPSLTSLSPPPPIRASNKFYSEIPVIFDLQVALQNIRSIGSIYIYMQSSHGAL